MYMLVQLSPNATQIDRIELDDSLAKIGLSLETVFTEVQLKSLQPGFHAQERGHPDRCAWLDVTSRPIRDITSILDDSGIVVGRKMAAHKAVVPASELRV